VIAIENENEENEENEEIEEITIAMKVLVMTTDTAVETEKAEEIDMARALVVEEARLLLRLHVSPVGRDLLQEDVINNLPWILPLQQVSLLVLKCTGILIYV
jgi:hypothetical protein